jgi:hypothetical protein
MKKRRQSYEEITTCEAESLQEAFSYLNKNLYGGKLPDAFIRYETKANSDGFYTPDGFSGRAAKFGKDAITLNSSRFDGRSDKQILLVLDHQMRHHWQWHFGKRPNRHYHDDEWSAKAIEDGVQPSSTGEDGGRITGQRMSQYIISGGRFDQICDELIATGWKLNLQSSHRPGAKKVKKDRPKFICPNCRDNIWGKPSTRQVCETCGFRMLPEDGDWEKLGIVRYELIKWSDEKPETAEAQSYETTKPKRGRPKGSKNKRKPGRPKGSKNKPKLVVSYEQQPLPVIKRKPGRPKGSKNKPKQLAA